MYNEAKLKADLNNVLDNLGEYLSQIRTGRPNPAIFEPIKVEAYGSTMSVRDIASTSMDGNTVFINPYDKQVVSAIVKAIQAADLGYNPVDEGNRVKVVVPAPTEETRGRILDQMNITVEEKYRKWIRSIRGEYMRDLDKLEGVSEDAVELSKKQVQKHIDEAMAKIDKMAEAKAAEVQQN